MKCKKVAYATKKAAVKVLDTIKACKNYQTKAKKELRSYKCLDCGMFHLTSMPKRDYQSPEVLQKTQIEERVASVASYWEHRLGVADE